MYKILYNERPIHVLNDGFDIGTYMSRLASKITTYSALHYPTLEYTFQVEGQDVVILERCRFISPSYYRTVGRLSWIRVEGR
jgi:hypothetical protein